MAKKIMVVEDDPHIVDYLINIFTENGYETCSAADGSKAYEVLKREKPDLITLDLQMPEEWGPKFYRKFSQDEEFKDIPVIVISGLAGAHLSIKKVVATIKKPFDPKKVAEIVEKAIGPAR